MTTIETVGILSPGDMGSGVGAVLHDHGLRVLTCLAGRGGDSRKRAEEAGIQDVADLEVLVRECEVILSICPPHAALDVARAVAGFGGLFVERYTSQVVLLLARRLMAQPSLVAVVWRR